MHAELFPREVTSNLPYVSLTGHERLHVEQHQGLLDYAPDSILLRTSCGLMRIDGAGMRFAMYNAGEATITGHIDSVSFQTREAAT